LKSFPVITCFEFQGQVRNCLRPSPGVFHTQGATENAVTFSTMECPPRRSVLLAFHTTCQYSGNTQGTWRSSLAAQSSEFLFGCQHSTCTFPTDRWISQEISESSKCCIWILFAYFIALPVISDPFRLLHFPVINNHLTAFAISPTMTPRTILNQYHSRGYAYLLIWLSRPLRLCPWNVCAVYHRYRER